MKTRERLVWTLGLFLVVVLALKLPGSVAQRDDDYAFVRTLVSIHQEILTNYVKPVNDQELQQKAIDGMMSVLDPYSVYIPPGQQEDFDRMLDNSFRGVGIVFDIENGNPTVVTPIEGSPAFDAGVRSGDVLMKVNGQNIQGASQTELSQKIGGPLGSTVTLTVRHPDGKIVNLTMNRREIVLSTVKGFERNPDASWNDYVTQDPKIAYLRITQFTENTFDELHDALVGRPAEPGKPAVAGLLDTGMKGLILDLRFNPGGRLEQAIKIVNMFVKQGVIVSTHGRNRPESVVRATGLGTLPYFPMIVLVNDHSASAAEIVSGSLKDNHRALIIGQRTFGKGSVQELIPLEDNGGELKLTVAYYYLPSGRLVNRGKDSTDWGVIPQINVPLDQEAEERVLEEITDMEAIPTSARPPTTQPAILGIDPQLRQAVNTMTGLIVLQGGQQTAEAAPAAPATQPAMVQ